MDRIKLMAKEHNQLARQMVMYKEMAEDLQNQMASTGVFQGSCRLNC